MEKDAQIYRQFVRYLAGEHTMEDFRDIQHYLHTHKEGGGLAALIEAELAKEESDTQGQKEKVDRIISSLDQYIASGIDYKDKQVPVSGIKGKAQRSLLRYISIAASLILAVAFGWYGYNILTPEPSLHSKYGDDVLPGSNRATLIMADGRVILLDTAQNGLLSSTQGIAISKEPDGTITYRVQDPTGDAGNNTITTPAGGQYQLILPDGSKVWLNAASSLTYPVRFTGTSRPVQLSGEAYFQVAHDVDKPFLVSSGPQVVKVLGTQFNVRNYADGQGVATTLVEGAVLVSDSESVQSLKMTPGQQVRFSAGKMELQPVDVLDYTSWKDGLLVLDNADLPTVAREIERWYDVAFDLPPLSGSKSVYVQLRRDVKLSEVLETLEEIYQVTFKIEGRRIIVRN